MHPFCLEHGLTRFEPRARVLWEHLVAVHPSALLPGPDEGFRLLMFDEQALVLNRDFRAYLPAEKYSRKNLFEKISAAFWGDDLLLQMDHQRGIGFFPFNFKNDLLFDSCHQITLHIRDLIQPPRHQIVVAVGPARSGKTTWINTAMRCARSLTMTSDEFIFTDTPDLELILEILKPECVGIEHAENLTGGSLQNTSPNLDVLARRVPILLLTASDLDAVPQTILNRHPLIHHLKSVVPADEFEEITMFFDVELTPELERTLHNIGPLGASYVLECVGRERLPLKTRLWVEESGYFG